MRCPRLARRSRWESSEHPGQSRPVALPSAAAAGAGMRTSISRLTGTAAMAGVLMLAAACATRAPQSASDGIPPPPSAPVVAALAPAAAPEPSLEYRIQSGDELNVRFPYQPDVNEQLPVRPDGRITLATTGELVVAGMTPSELQDLIIKKSSSKLRNPDVVVIVTKVAEQRVYVGGEGRKPGYVTLLP